MLTTSELDGMRATSRSALPDTVLITEPSEGGTLDPVTGVFTPNAAAEVYAGPGRVRVPSSATEMERIFGDREVTVQRYIGVLPWDAVNIDRDHRLAVTDGTDPDIERRSFRVVAVASGSNHIDRLLGLEEVEG